MHQISQLWVILLYNFETAIFRSIGETKMPLEALAVSGVLNVALNLFFCNCAEDDGKRSSNCDGDCQCSKFGIPFYKTCQNGSGDSDTKRGTAV